MRTSHATALTLAVIAVVAYAAWPAGDEHDRIRAVVGDAARAFTSGNGSDCLAAFEPEFEDRSGAWTITRETLRVALHGALSRRGGDATWIARIVDDSVTIDAADLVAGDAEVRFSVELLRAAPGSAYVDSAVAVWTAAVEAAMRRDAGGTWRFSRARHRTLAGRAPYR